MPHKPNDHSDFPISRRYAVFARNPDTLNVIVRKEMDYAYLVGPKVIG